MRLIWAGQALADRQEIRQYIEQDNPAAAKSLDKLFAEKAALLLDNPGLGRQGRVAGTRELVAHPNYILVYAVDDDRVRLLNVIHVAKQWPPKAYRPR